MIFLVNDRREFYKKIAENSLRDIKTKRTIKTTRNSSYSNRGNNRNTTKNGMIKFEQEPTKAVKSKFFTQCIICVLIIGVFYYLSNNSSTNADYVINKTKILLDSKINIEDKIDKIISKLNLKKGTQSGNNVNIDDEIIEQMEEEIEKTPKK